MGNKAKERQYGLQVQNTVSRLALRQHAVPRAIVVVAVHPRDGHEMRKLPQKEQGVEYPCPQTQSTGCCSPPDEGRHSPLGRHPPEYIKVFFA